jgi:hypothetical protein
VLQWRFAVFEERVLINGQVEVRDGVLLDAVQVHASYIFEILDTIKAEGFKIVFMDDFGQPHPRIKPNDLR